jgi:hypothetical protein
VFCCAPSACSENNSSLMQPVNQHSIVQQAEADMMANGLCE